MTNIQCVKKFRFNQKCVTQTVISSHASLSLWPGWFAPLFLSPLYIAMLMDFVVVLVCCFCCLVGFFVVVWCCYCFFFFGGGLFFLVIFCPVCVSVCVRACMNF